MTTEINYNWNHGVLGHIGLTEYELRLMDELASKAMQSMCVGEGATMLADRDENYDESKGNWAEVVADNAYNFAEAMILERSKRMESNKKSRRL